MNSNKLYISVLLSTYNDEKYIAKSISSILNQTYPYFEFIIVNDGSTDRTLDIIKSFKDPRIVLIDKPNTGLIDSLNIGVQAAKYNWIARIDGDDIAEPNRFEEQTNLIHDGIAIISSQCTIIDAQDNIIGYTKFKERGLGQMISKIFALPLIAHPTVIFNKSYFESVGGFDPMMYVAEDYDLWCKMLSKGELIISKKRLLRLRKHGNNISLLKREHQIINSSIAYIKSTHRIHRNLSKEEYTSILTVLNKSIIFKYCYHKDRYSSIGKLFSVICRFIDTYCNVNIIRVCRHIPK